MTTPVSEFATAMPRSSWQWVLSTHFWIPGTCSTMPRIMSPYSTGVEYPTVSGMLSVVAPASTTAGQHLVEVAGLGARGVHGRELDIVRVALGAQYHLPRDIEGLGARLLILVIEMHVGRRHEHVNARMPWPP